MSKILRQSINLLLTVTIAGTVPFTLGKPINFIPDEVIIRSVHYFNNGTEVGVSTLETNMIDNIPAIANIIDSRIPYTPNSIFPVNRPIRGTYSMTFYDNTGALDTTRTGTLAILLEFIKYL
jgi:hypothetical protein